MPTRRRKTWIERFDRVAAWLIANVLVPTIALVILFVIVVVGGLGVGLLYSNGRHLITLPLALFVLAVCSAGLVVSRTVILQGLQTRRLRRELNRSKQGLCRKCGYDVRASEEFCSECGTLILLRPNPDFDALKNMLPPVPDPRVNSETVPPTAATFEDERDVDR